jgi:hypothetical protein
MSKRTSGDEPSLVEVLKALARDRLTVGREAYSRRDSARSKPEDEAAFALFEEYCDHPILDFCRLVEDETGLDRHLVEDVACRSNTGLGLAPLTRTPRPPDPAPTDPELDVFPAAEPMPDVPDLRPVLGQFKEYNGDGTTARVLRRFEREHPGVLDGLGFPRVTEDQLPALRAMLRTAPAVDTPAGAAGTLVPPADTATAAPSADEATEPTVAGQPVDPAPPTAGSPEANGQYAVLCDRVRELAEERVPELRAMLARLKAAIPPTGAAGSQVPPADAAPAIPPADQPPADPKDSDRDWQAVVAAVADDNAVAIIKVAGDTSKTVDERMRSIYAIDNRALGWTSPKWAKVLGVSDAAVRQTEWWTKERRRLMRE